MSKIEDADRVTLAVGEFTRRGVLWAHAIGMVLTSGLFLTDALRGSFNNSVAYARVNHLPGGPTAWALWPLIASLLLLTGLVRNRWRYAVTGLLGLCIWYGAQAALVTVNWSKGGQIGLLGPVGVYGLVLFPKAITHAVGIALNGRRLDRE